MISMVVTHNDAFDGLLGNFPDQAHQLVGQGWGTQCVENHHTFAGYHEAGVRHESLIFTGRGARQALHKITMRAHPYSLHGYACAIVIGVGDGQRKRKQHQHNANKHGNSKGLGGYDYRAQRKRIWEI